MPKPLRQGVRALILDPLDHLLLVNLDGEEWQFAGGLWVTPGGGIEPGEDPQQALRRELKEETGLQVTEIGPEIWTSTIHAPSGGWAGQINHIHLVRAERFEPAPSFTLAQLRAEHIHGHRWWSPQDLYESAATFAPRRLSTLVRGLLEHGVPDPPLQLTGN